MAETVIVVGAGQTAASFTSRCARLGSQLDLVLVGDEPVPPYQRPPLSKKYMSGELDKERLFIRPQEWYDEQGVKTRFDTRVTSIDRHGKQIETANGERLDYDKLILATGSSPRKLPKKVGGDLENVFTLRNIADVEAMAPEFVPGRKLLIIGGGYIGLEAAAVARKLELEVCVLEMADRILQRVAAAETADYFRQLHQSHGVEIRESTKLDRLLEKSGRVVGAELSTGEQIQADLVLVGIGAMPNSQLAEDSGLVCENGIAVDDHCLTSDPQIYAAGDCASFRRNGQRIRLESVQNATDQGDLIARLLAGEEVNYDALPWFWSDQYDCKLQIAGLNNGFTETLQRPGAKPGGVSIWYYNADRLIAVDAINDPLAYAMGRKIIGLGLSPTRQQISNPDVDLKSLSRQD